MTAATSARPVTVAQASRGGGSGVAAGGCGVVWPGSPGVAGPTAYTVYDARRPTGGIFSGQAHSDTGAVPREGIAIRRVSRISCQVLLRGVPTKCTSGRATGGGGYNTSTCSSPFVPCGLVFVRHAWDPRFRGFAGLWGDFFLLIILYMCLRGGCFDAF